MEKLYWIRVGTENKGPYSLVSLLQMDAKDHDYVWTSGMESWVQLAHIAEFQLLKNKDESSSTSIFFQNLLISLLVLFCALFIYIFLLMPFYKREFGGRTGIDVLSEVAFDEPAFLIGLPPRLFMLLMALIPVVSLVYLSVKSKSDNTLPLLGSFVFLLLFPTILMVYEPKEMDNVPLQTTRKNLSIKVVDSPTVEHNEVAEIISEENIEDPLLAADDINRTAKLYAIVVHSYYEPETREIYPSFSSVFRIDAGISASESKKITAQKIKEIQKTDRSRLILHSQLKAFDSPEQAQQYIDAFDHMVYVSGVTDLTFDTIINYVDERSLIKVFEKLK